MSEVFFERSFRAPVTATEAGALALEIAHELDPTGTRREFLLSTDGRRLLCRLDSHTPVASLDAGSSRIWSGTARHTGAASSDAAAEELVDLVGERSLDAQSRSGARPLEHACRWCAAVHRVHLVEVFESTDGLRVIGIFRAPDAESVRLAYHGASEPLDSVWTYRRVPLAAARAADVLALRFARMRLGRS